MLRQAVAGQAVFGRTIEADLSQLSPSRSELLEWLEALGCVSSPRAGDMALVFTELLTNAIEACAAGQSVDYSFHCDREAIAVRVANPNPDSSAVEFQSMPDPESESGRGLALAQIYADRLHLLELGDAVNLEALFLLEAQPMTIATAPAESEPQTATVHYLHASAGA